MLEYLGDKLHIANTSGAYSLEDLTKKNDEAFYLYDLASDFHGLYHQGNADQALRFVQEGDSDTTQAKIALIRAVSIVISHGLGILGVTPMEEMR